MTEEETALQNYATAQQIRRGLGTPMAKKALELMKNHFNCHITSSALANFDTNQTFYQYGSKAVFLTIDQILSAELYGEEPKFEQHTSEDNEQ